MKRRDFLKTSAVAACAVLAPRFALAQAAGGYRNLLRTGRARRAATTG